MKASEIEIPFSVVDRRLWVLKMRGVELTTDELFKILESIQRFTAYQRGSSISEVKSIG